MRRSPLSWALTAEDQTALAATCPPRLRRKLALHRNGGAPVITILVRGYRFIYESYL